MPPRIQVQDLYKDRGYSPSITPTASPVDTFVGPAKVTNPNRQVLELINAFQDVQPGLSAFARERVEKANEIDVEEGRKAALANKAQFKEAVDAGAIPAGASPWFRVGWERQKARVAGEDYDRGLREAYAKSGVAESDDPTAFNAFVAAYTEGWQAENSQHADNPEFPSVFGQIAEKAQSNLANAHAGIRTQKIEADVIQNTELELDSVLESDEELLISNGTTKPQALANVVNAQVANGLSGQVANKLVADTVIRRAEETGDFLLLDILDEVPSGSGTVGQIGWVKDRVARARDQIAREQHENARLGNLRDEQAKKDEIQRLQTSINEKLFADPFGADIKEELSQLNAVDPAEAIQASGWRSALITSMTVQNKTIENDLVKTDLFIRASQGGLTDAEVRQAVADRKIDADTAKSLITDLIPKAKEHKAIIELPAVRRTSTDLKMTITGNELSPDFNSTRRELAAQADEMFSVGMLRWATQNPEKAKDTEEVIIKAGKLRQAILSIPGFMPEADRLPDVKGDYEKSVQPEEPVAVNADTAKANKLFKTEEEFKAALQEALTTGGKTGKLKALADLYKIDVFELTKAQQALFRPKPK